MPRKREPNTTLLASVTPAGMEPCVAVEGATTKAVFKAYVEQALDQEGLRVGQVVVLDNLAAHKGESVRELVEGRGCELMYLPPYSPDLNPIEEAFSKIEALLRRAGARTRGAPVEAMGRALSAITAGDVRGFFEHCGYRQVGRPPWKALKAREANRYWSRPLKIPNACSGRCGWSRRPGWWRRP